MINFLKQLKTIPEEPGVYLIRDESDEVIFVARAMNIKERIRSHLIYQKSRRNAMIAKHIASVEFEIIENQLQATRRELELIQQYYPPLNGRKKGMKQYRFVKIFDQEKFPRARKKKFIEESDTTILGPFPKSRHIQKVLSVAANYYRIADCGKVVELGDTHKIVTTCIRRRTEQCMRPCQVEVDQQEYQAAVDAFIKFFRGDDESLIEDLKEQMRNAVTAEKFEKAAKIRDDLESISKIGL